MADDGPTMTIADFQSAMREIASHLQDKSPSEIRDDLAVIVHDYREYIEDELVLRLIAVGGALTKIAEDTKDVGNPRDRRTPANARDGMNLQ